jgi:HAD superfamily hydrolase (TIGR01548 family)
LDKLNVDTILFDIDGVLVDVSQSYRIAIAKTTEFFTGEKIDMEEIQALKEQTGFNNEWDLTEELVKQRGKTVEKQTIIDKFQEYYLGTNGQKGLIENETWLLDKDLLTRLSENFKLGIITGRPKDEADIALDVAGVKDYFKVIIAMEDVTKGKPDPQGINMAMEKLGGEKAIYIGDVSDDIRAAKNAGVIAVGCMPPETKENRREVLNDVGAIIVLNKVDEIKDAIEWK